MLLQAAVVNNPYRRGFQRDLMVLSPKVPAWNRPCFFEGGTLSREDLIQLEGTVTRVLGGGTMEIECDNQVIVRGVLSGRMKKHRIKVIKGDRVQVSVSPYDTSHGIITFRFA